MYTISIEHKVDLSILLFYTSSNQEVYDEEIADWNGYAHRLPLPVRP